MYNAAHPKQFRPAKIKKNSARPLYDSVSPELPGNPEMNLDTISAAQVNAGMTITTPMGIMATETRKKSKDRTGLKMNT